MNTYPRHMTPQEIVDASQTVDKRMIAHVKEQMRVQNNEIKAERARIQAACLHSTGHVFGMAKNYFGPDYRACVYCGALPPGAHPHTEPEDQPSSDV